MKKIPTLFGPNHINVKRYVALCCFAFMLACPALVNAATPPQWDSIKRWNWDYNTPSSGWLLADRNIEFVYDANGDLVSVLRESRFPPSTSVTLFKTINTYNSSHKVLSSTVQVYLNNAWIVYSILTLTYDANNNITDNLQLAMNDAFTALETQRHITASFDANNNQTSYLDSSYQGGTWNIGALENTYDAANNTTRNVEKNWYNNQWLITTNWTRTYDAQRNKVKQLDSVWSSNGFLQLVLNNTFINQYDANNNLITQLDSINRVRSNYTYDTNNNKLSTTIQGWNGNSLTYVKTYKVDYTYDVSNNLISKIDSTFNTPYSTVLRSIDRVYYTYNANKKVLTELTQIWAGGSNFRNGKITDYTYDTEEINYILVNKYFDGTGVNISSGDSTYFYKRTSSTFVNNNLISASLVNVYPNPATSTLNITCEWAIEKAEVFSLTGALQNTTLTQNNIDINLLNPGIYFIKIHTSKGIAYLKFNKE